MPEAEVAVGRLNGIFNDRFEKIPSSYHEAMVGFSLDNIELWPFKAQADRDRLREGWRKASSAEAKTAAGSSPLYVEGATTIDTAQAKGLHDRGVPFVSALFSHIWKAGHIPGSFNLPFSPSFAERLANVVSKDEEVVIYDLRLPAIHSAEASGQAVSWGFTKVYYFHDGLPGWEAAGYPVEVP